MLSIQNISKNYASKIALDNVSIDIADGCIFGLLGPNGAGKTTLIRIITNIIGSDNGTVLFKDVPLREKHTSQIGYMPEERGLYKKMKVGEQLLYLAQLKGLSKKDAKKKIDEWLEKFEITDWWNKKVEELSKGMQQKIQFITTIVHDPDLIILDEPFSGLDPVNSTLIRDEIYNLKNAGKTVIFSTHRMEQVEEICDDIALINNGKKILEGKVTEVKQQFKKNMFSVVHSTGNTFVENEKFKILESKENEWIFQLSEQTSSKELLKYLLETNVDIVSFNEILPSLNEIFIEQVTYVPVSSPNLGGGRGGK